jgi:hypothetical protein
MADYERALAVTSEKGRLMDWGGMKIWKDEEGKLWTLADSGIDTEIFEIVGKPVYDEASGFWRQQIALRVT